MPISAPMNRILDQLRLGREAAPEWAEVLDLHIALSEAQIASNPPPINATLSAQQAIERRRQGLPLIGGLELELDWDAIAALYQKVCLLSAEHRSDLASAFTDLAAKALEDPDQLQTWTSRLLIENGLGDDDPLGLVTFALTNTLRPFLRRFAEAHAPLVDNTAWRRNYCPICGGEADFGAFSAKEEGTRYLLCSRCDNEWTFVRVACPFCDTREQEHLTYYPEKDGPHRLYVCTNCNRYIKTIDLRQAPGSVLLPVERVLTISMDVAARDKGFE